ncbi:MAG: DinB family protein [Phycisphaerales bacterium JB060]
MANLGQGDVLAHNILHTQTLFERFLAGFDESNRTSQAPAMPNHAAWTLGHLALTAYRCAERVGGRDEPGELPPDAFVMGDRGDAERFATESVAYGSTPTDEPDRYPSLQRSLEIMHGAHRTLARALHNASEDALARQTPWGGGQTSVADLALRMGFHIGTHCGQLIDLRRGLGFEPVLARR